VRVKAIAKGWYANTLIEPGQIFDLVDIQGIREIPVKNKNGEIVSQKRSKVVIKAEAQFSDVWMRKVKTGVKKTVATEKVGNELVVSEKGMQVPKERHFHNGKAYGNELQGSPIDEGDDDLIEGEDSDIDESVEAGVDEGVEAENVGEGEGDSPSSGENDVL
jgi:hypothetical protein